MVAQPLHGSNASSVSDDTFWPRCINWLALRKVRTALLASFALISIFLFLASTTRVEIPSKFSAAPQSEESSPDTAPSIIWRDFAYVQYVTNENYLCNSLMMLEALHRLKAKADRLMLYPNSWKIPNVKESDLDFKNLPETTRLLIHARDKYQAKLMPIEVQSIPRGDSTWRESFTKLLAFNQTQYKRVLSLDSDATLRQVSRHLNQ